jgi:hypothetical protein
MIQLLEILDQTSDSSNAWLWETKTFMSHINWMIQVIIERKAKNGGKSELLRLLSRLHKLICNIPSL